MNTKSENRLADYLILREAGRGAMSTVYEAVNERDGRTVALKVLMAPATLPASQQHSLIARLQREARLIAGLSHPNIVRILDVGEAEGHHYLAMEFLHGTTIRERLNEGPLPLTEASLVLDQVAAALDAIHAERIVHRDIKPSNVMILPDGHVKLMDFGIARQGDDTTITQTGMIVGSPAYMSPEQIRGEAGTAESDLWALGVLLYEMLSSRSPFPGPNIPAVLYKVTHDPPLPIAGFPPAVQHVLRRALEKNPSRRFRTAREMADALRATFVRLPPRSFRGGGLLPSFGSPALWRSNLLIAAGLLALGLSTAFLEHISRRAPHTPPSDVLSVPHGLRSLPGNRAAAPKPQVGIREIPFTRKLKTPPKLHPAIRKARHASKRHLARRVFHSYHRHATAQPYRHRRPYHPPIFHNGSSLAPNYEHSVPMHPVYNPASPI